jgi:hypothetical protein
MAAPSSIPTQEEFLAAPLETVSAVAPRSMVYAPGGTRRSATFAGIEPWSAAHVRESQNRFVDCLEVIFRYGVEHVFSPMIMVGHVNEVEDVERQLIVRVGEFATDPYLLDMIGARGWQIKLAPSAYSQVLDPYVAALQAHASGKAAHTWWMTITPSYDSWWADVIAVAKSDQVSTRADAIRALYGQDVPPITLCLAFGKPTVSPDLFPQLLMDNVQCYWSQQAGYTLADLQYRKVLYDYAYLRRTWQKDKIARAKEAQAQREIWEQEVILGLGKRYGPFWYPDLR